VKLKFKKKTSPKTISRRKKKVRVRATLTGTQERPRLTVYRSLRAIYAQLIDDVGGVTILASNTMEKGKSANNKAAAGNLGKEIAEKAKQKNISKVVFDRNGYLYHGRVKAVADAARAAGLEF
jgi:large subunit ribosomal protein L18